jgi:hypothetical protein
MPESTKQFGTGWNVFPRTLNPQCLRTTEDFFPKWRSSPLQGASGIVMAFITSDHKDLENESRAEDL